MSIPARAAARGIDVLVGGAYAASAVRRGDDLAHLLGSAHTTLVAPTDVRRPFGVEANLSPLLDFMNCSCRRRRLADALRSPLIRCW